MNSPAPYSARLILRIAGTAVSEDEVYARCDQVAQFASTHAGCQRWFLKDLLWLPLQIPRGQYAVQIGRTPLGDAGHGAHGEWIAAETMEAAICIIRANTHDLAREERTAWDRLFGRLMDGNGDIVARLKSDLSFAWRSTRFHGE